jgi:hypothetical protein
MSISFVRNNTSSADWQQNVAFAVMLFAIVGLASLRVACSIHPLPKPAASSQSLAIVNSLWLMRSGL